MTRPSDITRERILKAAERLFADRGYEETSIRGDIHAWGYEAWRLRLSYE